MWRQQIGRHCVLARAVVFGHYWEGAHECKRTLLAARCSWHRWLCSEPTGSQPCMCLGQPPVEWDTTIRSWLRIYMLAYTVLTLCTGSPRSSSQEPRVEPSEATTHVVRARIVSTRRIWALDTCHIPVRVGLKIAWKFKTATSCN